LPSFRTVTRKELYDLVWSRPMRDVAIEFGISDVGLGKTCARCGIPKPPRGYWARLRAGQKIRQQPLSRAADAESEKITIYSTTSRIPEAARQVLSYAKDGGKIADLAADASPPASLPVIDLYKPIKLTALTLRKSKPSRDGAVSATDEGMHGVIVSTMQVERAVFILDGLARRLDKEGLTLAPGGSVMRVAVGQDDISVTLLERTRRQKHVPTPDELRAGDDMAGNRIVLCDHSGPGELLEREETPATGVDLETVPFPGNDAEILQESARRDRGGERVDVGLAILTPHIARRGDQLVERDERDGLSHRLSLGSHGRLH